VVTHAKDMTTRRSRPQVRRRIGHLHLALLLAAVGGGCARRTAPPPAVAQPAAEAPRPAADEPDTQARDGSDLPPPWWTPLPALSLGALTEHEIAAAKACGDAHDLSSRDTAAADLLTAAHCFGAARAFGKEIAMYRRILADHRGAEEAAIALLDLGQRHEQLDDRPAAIAVYADVLARYPTREDARALGQRAVCLAASLEDTQTVEKLLSQLDELYGRRGFVVPPSQALVQLCTGLPPVRR
jgi:tetratricopeptide (TPR) repeat protein